jgi:NADH-quinone oxidoreductase subunit E
MDNEKVDKIIDKYQSDPSLLIQMLLEIQRENRWLPKEALERISSRLEVPLNRIQQIVTFYKVFSLVAKGRHEIHVCTGTACHVRGAPRLLDSVKGLVGISPGETDLDLKYSLETVNCVGCCALGPVIVMDGQYHGQMNPRKVTSMLSAYAAGEGKVEE